MYRVKCDICGRDEDDLRQFFLNGRIYRFKARFWERSKDHIKKFDVCELCLRKIKEEAQSELRTIKQDRYR